MGFRFRKSVSIGGFRINFSKSGIGYSFGGKGFRYTKKANGGHRATLSVPGTGISYVTESGANKTRTNSRMPYNDQRINQEIEPQPLYTIESSSDFVSSSKQDFVDSIRHYYKVKKQIKWAILWESFILIGLFIGTTITLSTQSKTDFPLFFAIPLVIDSVAIVASIIAFFIYRAKGRVKAQYTFDEIGKQHLARLENAITCLKQSKMINCVHQVFSLEARRNGGATRTLAMEPVHFKKKSPKFLKTNIRCYCAPLKQETYYVLPDMIIVTKRKMINAVDLNDLEVLIDSAEFITEKPAKDANIVRYTWNYVNKDGSPDRRFAHNYKLAVTQCASLLFTTSNGFMLKLQMSNVISAQKFGEIVADMIDRKRQEG